MCMGGMPPSALYPLPPELQEKIDRQYKPLWKDLTFQERHPFLYACLWTLVILAVLWLLTEGLSHVVPE